MGSTRVLSFMPAVCEVRATPSRTTLSSFPEQRIDYLQGWERDRELARPLRHCANAHFDGHNSEGMGRRSTFSTGACAVSDVERSDASMLRGCKQLLASPVDREELLKRLRIVEADNRP